MKERKKIYLKKRNTRLFLFIFKNVFFIMSLILIGASFYIGYPTKIYDSFVSFCQKRLADFGFSFQKLEIFGNKYASYDGITKAVGLRKNDFIGARDIHEIRSEILKLYWVKHVVVERILPYKIKIRITETYPIGILKSAKKFFYIDALQKLVPYEPYSYIGINYPIFVGKDAHLEAHLLLKCLSPFPTLRSHIKSYHFLRQGRWNLLLDTKTIVQLPCNYKVETIQKLAKIWDKYYAFFPNLEVLDMRSDDIVVKLIPGATIGPKTKSV